jgi:hypothetical protein
MKEHPIIFSTLMVQGILAGRKSMTRRIIKPQPDDDGLWNDDLLPRSLDSKLKNWNGETIEGESREWKCPYGKPGDVLWVREKWENETSGGKQINFYAGNNEVEHNVAYRTLTKWKPSIHMPRAASRIMLKVISIRVERLQDISKQDAINEGIDIVYDQADPLTPLTYFYPCNDLRDGTYICDDPILSFYSLWTKINGSGSWESNPWVWVIEFERLT